MPKLLQCEEHQTLLVGEQPGAFLTESDVAQLMRVQGAVGALNWIDRHRVRSSEHVGVIVAPRVRLEILPKIAGFGSDAARKTLIRMLAQAWDIPIREGELAPMASQKHDLLEILIYLFARRLNAEVRKGLVRTYERHDDHLARLRGKLDVVRQYSRNAAYPHRLACAFDELTADTSMNRLFLSALQMLRRRTAVSATEQLLRETAFHFEDVELVPAEVALRARIALGSGDRRWFPVVNLARLLLQGTFQSTHLGAEDGVALLFDMNALFESYVAALVRKVAGGLGYALTTQGPYRALVSDEMGKNVMYTKPDMYLDLDGRSVVLDTKWKQLESNGGLGVAAADLYQMHAYHRVYGTRETVLIFPHAPALSGEGTQMRWTFVESSGSLRIMNIDLNHPHIFTDQLAAMLQSVLRAPAAITKTVLTTQ